MSLILTGRTTADYGNPSRVQTLAGATLVFYAYPKGAASLREGRWSFSPQDERSVGARELGRAVVRDDGSYSAELATATETLLVAIGVERFSYAPATGKKTFGVLGVVSPDFRASDLQRLEGVRVALADVRLPRATYCDLLAALDLWLVAGQVLTSSTPQSPLPGLSVRALDRDISEDDDLGAAPTDATGSFEIFFEGARFRGIPVLPPPFDRIEPVELFGGPDLYFHVRAGTAPLLEEPPAAGRASGRENVQNCSFTTLLVAGPPLDQGVGSGPTVWQSVGNYALLPATAVGSNDFDARGLTRVGALAFTGSIKLKGTVFRRAPSGQPIRYRFLFAEWTDARATAGGPATPPIPPPGSVSPRPSAPAGWKPLTTQIDSSAAYAHILSWTPGGGPVASLPLLPAPDTNGWIEVDQRALGPGEWFIPDGLLALVRTDLLVPATTPGAARPRKLSLVLEIQTASQSFQQGPYPLHVSNDGVHLAYTLTSTGTGCDAVSAGPTSTITVAATYEVSHPYLESYGFYVQRHDGVGYQPWGAETYTSPSAGVFWTPPGGISGATSRPGYEVMPCAYQSGVSAQARLTTGEGKVHGVTLQKGFCVR
jgi:hypothetical protein